jgi:hypothetical protein
VHGGKQKQKLKIKKLIHTFRKVDRIR